MIVPLSGDEFFLAVSHNLDLSRHTVHVCKTMDSILQTWGESTRCSPVFALNNSARPDLESTTEITFCFIGPLYPGLVPLGIPAFLTFGIHNILLIASTPAEHLVLENYLHSDGNKIAWEKWRILNGIIVSVDYASAIKEISPNKCYDVGPISLPKGLISVTDEYRTLIASTQAKAMKYLPQISEEICTFDKYFRPTLELKAHRDVTKSQWLVNVNAALARFSTQTFSGISPILSRECHYWTHSLLGIGLATQGLVAIRRQAQEAASCANFSERIKALKNTPPNPIRLEDLKLADGFWQKHHLPNSFEQSGNSVSDMLPQIVCFSGRDGFRSTTHSLSVPLEVISASNTVGWTLRTVTHEISHGFLDLILAAILPDTNSEDGLNRLFNVCDKKPASNLYEQLQAYLCFSLCMLSAPFEINDTSKVIDVTNGDQLATHIQEQYQETSEVLTHIFDFLYFYQRDSKTYISSIWGSWDVIPNITDRIDDYLIRTLCAILVQHLSVSDAFEITIMQVQEHLIELRTHFPDGAYVGDAINRLTTKRTEFKNRLHHLQHLVRLSYSFLYSPDVASVMYRSMPEARSKKKSTIKSFKSDRLVENPLKFIYEHSGNSMITNIPDTKKSAWLFAELAFSNTNYGN